jgi:hypothetical protein
MDERFREWRRWSASEAEGRDDEADEAFRALFRSVPHRVPRVSLASQVERATAQAAVRQARLAKAAVLAGVAGGVALMVLLLLQIPRLLQATLDLVIGAIVSTTLALSRGVDAWTVLAQIARAIGGVVVTPQGTYALSGLGLVAIGALYALHRMLELEERSSL